MDYNLLLKKNGKCEFPPMPLIESFKELESNDDDLFYKDEVNDLYENEPKADTWQALSWDRDALHRSDKAIITNISVLGSDDCKCDNCDITKKNYLKTTKFF